MKIIKDIQEIPRENRVFIYGSGIAARAFGFYVKKMRPDIKVLGFIDSFKSGKCCGLKIYKFNDFIKKINKSDFDIILIASMYYEEISKTLEKNRVKNYALVKGKNPAFSLFVREKSLLSYLKGLLYGIADKIIPKSKNRFVVVGEYGGNFTGNSKYFYLYLQKLKGIDVYWLTNNKEYYDYLQSQGINAIRYGKPRTYITLLRSKYLIFDNRDWYLIYDILNYLSSKKIQLWHGVGFKYIELALLPDRFLSKLTQQEKKILKKRYPEYDLLITTSDFYAKEVFSPALGVPFEKTIPSGYPRNDVFYKKIEEELINTDLNIVDFVSKHSGKIIVFTPTFRDLKMSMDLNNIFNYEKLNDFLLKNNLLFIIKGHSLPNYKYLTENIEKYSNILIYNSKKDIYPLLRETDLLITDYSSIYTDFLHTGKPVLFYPFDYDEYSDLHRQLQFDYDKMTPGPKAENFEDLIKWIKHFLIEGKDGFEKERERIFNLSFKYQNGESSERVYQRIISLK